MKLKNPLMRHVALFLAVKAVLIGLGLWWFNASMPAPRGALPPVTQDGVPPPAVGQTSVK